MEITEAQYERIKDALPVQRGNVKLSNLQMLNAVLYVAEHVPPESEASSVRKVRSACSLHWSFRPPLEALRPFNSNLQNP
jgi:hypothetical protein